MKQDGKVKSCCPSIAESKDDLSRRQTVFSFKKCRIKLYNSPTVRTIERLYPRNISQLIMLQKLREEVRLVSCPSSHSLSMPMSNLFKRRHYQTDIIYHPMLRALLLELPLELLPSSRDRERVEVFVMGCGFKR